MKKKHQTIFQKNPEAPDMHKANPKAIYGTAGFHDKLFRSGGTENCSSF